MPQGQQNGVGAEAHALYQRARDNRRSDDSERHPQLLSRPSGRSNQCLSDCHHRMLWLRLSLLVVLVTVKTVFIATVYNTIGITISMIRSSRSKHLPRRAWHLEGGEDKARQTRVAPHLHVQVLGKLFRNPVAVCIYIYIHIYIYTCIYIYTEY